MSTGSGVLTKSKIPLQQLRGGTNYPAWDSSGIIDVVRDYPWSFTPTSIFSKQDKVGAWYNVPFVHLVEYEQDVNAVFAQLSYWARAIAGTRKTNNIYEGLYTAVPTGIQYIFPFYEEYHHNITQTWKTNSGIFNVGLVQEMLKAVQTFEQITQQAAGASINQPKVWGGSGTVEYGISFYLFNTITASIENNNGDIDQLGLIDKNQKLINRLIMATLHDQVSPILANPPALFQLWIPGIRQSPACVISNLEVKNIGQINRLHNSKGVWNENGYNVPDAWQINIRITELIPESRQIYDGLINDRIITAFKGPSQPNSQTTLNVQTNAGNSSSQGALEHSASGAIGANVGIDETFPINIDGSQA